MNTDSEQVNFKSHRNFVTKEQEAKFEEAAQDYNPVTQPSLSSQRCSSLIQLKDKESEFPMPRSKYESNVEHFRQLSQSQAQIQKMNEPKRKAMNDTF